MTRLYGRAPRGHRVHDAVPGGHWKMLTILGALHHTGMLAVMTVEAATDREVFLAYLDQVLCPRLRPGHVVVMDNLSAHKGGRSARAHRARWRNAALSAALLPGPEPYRKGLEQAKTGTPRRTGPQRASPRPSYRTPAAQPHRTRRASLVQTALSTTIPLGEML